MPVGDANEESPEVPTKPGHHERRADLSGLKRTFDRDDREIFVEKEDENGKPMVWYMYGTSGNLSRWEFGVFGTGGRHVDGPTCLFNTS
ncbi:MAG: hypothetical protein IPL32_02055 [Chloracidobacterium sp.]|nr:hypothetical protein [Chloracidobacterium sp.]